MLLVLVPGIAVAGQTAAASITGNVIDSSGAVLPGVSVTATSRVAVAPATTVTDHNGRFAFHQLSSGPQDISFELSGFEPRVERVVLGPGDSVALNAVLALASLREDVTVVAPAPSPAPEVTRSVDVPEARAVVQHASVCGPRQAVMSHARAFVAAVHQEPGRSVLGDRDVLVLDRGEQEGLAVGDNLVVRRAYVADRTARSQPMTPADQATALVQVVAIQAHSATARVLYACQEIAVGDRLEPFDAAPAFAAANWGTPDVAAPARVLFGEQGRSMAATADFVVIDQGANQGARPGQWVTIFRGQPGPRASDAVATALVVAVQPDSATIRIHSARDVVEAGDSAALHRQR